MGENFFEFSVFEGVPTDIVAHFGGKIKEGFAGDAGGGAPPFFFSSFAGKEALDENFSAGHVFSKNVLQNKEKCAIIYQLRYPYPFVALIFGYHHTLERKKSL